MRRRTIPLESFDFMALQIWNRWFVLTAGDFSTHQYNSMTISWGSFGVMWNKPFAQVVVRYSRYTYEFIDRYYADFDPAHFLAGYIEREYADGDYHRSYFGEIIAVESGDNFYHPQ
jgi:hypothetical protein